MAVSITLEQTEDIGYIAKDDHRKARLRASRIVRSQRQLRKRHLGLESRSRPIAKNHEGKPRVPKMRKEVKLGRSSISAPASDKKPTTSVGTIRTKKVQIAALLKVAIPTDRAIAAEHEFISNQAMLDHKARTAHTQ